MLSDQDLEDYYKKLANPVSTVTKNQRTMVDAFRVNVDRQKESKRRRQAIIDEKRRINGRLRQSTYQSPTPSESSYDVEVESNYSNITKIAVHDDDDDDNNDDTGSQIGQDDIRVTHNLDEPPIIIEQPNIEFPRVSVGLNQQDIDIQQERNAIYEDELKARMHDLGMSSPQASNYQQGSRHEELSYWRKRISLEEEAAVKQAGMLLSLLSSFVESFTNAVGFTTIKTQGLSEAIQDALENGDFDLAIKSYCVNPHAMSMLKNPVTSFMTSFGHVVLRTHIANVKRELQEGIDSYKRRKQEEHRREEAAANMMNNASTNQQNNIPWNVPLSNITDQDGNTRPRFELPASSSSSSTDIGNSFRNQMNKITPVIGALQQFATTSNTQPSQSLDNHLNPSQLQMQ